ncbi:MAG: 16S rRNA (adenine(1518)-N(6)/adenine(1519)-N(6))-dimethyltransferase RsmA [Bacteroidales bacterium]|nr:16S rRNA (adenine(1518)-N(6)/adenine(1519)-N(6))-dimethyltransferase RsmA [Bacteroidales bacterium]
MNSVTPKKSLGQHFLTDQNIARKIVGSLTFQDYSAVLEIGPGMGILTGYLSALKNREIKYIEIDPYAVDYLVKKFPEIQNKIITGDILKARLNEIYTFPFAIIGNLPYNISSQIFFKILTCRNLVREVVCMVQKEVADRIISPPGSRDYGILSVFLQAFYRIERLFNVNPKVFIPPPNVISSVIRLKRNEDETLGCDESLFFRVVKTAFNQRRKILSNSLKSLVVNNNRVGDLWHCRPEQLGVQDFIRLTSVLKNSGHDRNISDC